MGTRVILINLDEDNSSNNKIIVASNKKLAVFHTPETQKIELVNEIDVDFVISTVSAQKGMVAIAGTGECMVLELDGVEVTKKVNLGIEMSSNIIKTVWLSSKEVVICEESTIKLYDIEKPESPVSSIVSLEGDI